MKKRIERHILLAQKDSILKDYSTLNMVELALKYNSNRETLRHFLRDQGIEIRTNTQTKIVDNEGTVYNSISEASKKLNLNPNVIYRLLNKTFRRSKYTYRFHRVT